MVGFLLDKFTGSITLSKTKFFGLKKYHAEILITQTLRVVSVKTNIKDLPYKNGDVIDFLIIKNWAESNSYNIILKTKNNKLKRLFYFI